MDFNVTDSTSLSTASSANEIGESNVNKVELIGHYGSDETHACSAWTSTSRELTDEKRARIPAMLKMLAENGHNTPFEKSMLHFLVTCETASHVHILKHRIGVSVNAESARYKELKEDRWYTPTDWPIHLQERYNRSVKQSFDNYHRLLEELEINGITRKRAKESARLVLPYANQLTLDVTFNFRSFMHFQGLRNKKEAQEEIAWIAEEMLQLVAKTGDFQYSLIGFGVQYTPDLSGLSKDLE